MEETGEGGEIIVAAAEEARPDPDEAAVRVAVKIKIKTPEDRSIVQSLTLKPIKCAIAITSMVTRLGTAWPQLLAPGSTRSSRGHETLTSLDKRKTKRIILHTTRCFPA